MNFCLNIEHNCFDRNVPHDKYDTVEFPSYLSLSGNLDCNCLDMSDLKDLLGTNSMSIFSLMSLTIHRVPKNLDVFSSIFTLFSLCVRLVYLKQLNHYIN